MQKQNNTAISLIEYYENLKGLVEQKHKLEQNDQNNLTSYLKISKDIQELTNPLSLEDLKDAIIYCKHEYKNLVNSYNADMEPSILEKINNKLSVNDGCYDAIDKAIDLKKDFEYTR